MIQEIFFSNFFYVIYYHNVVFLISLTLYKKNDKININQILERHLK